MFNSELLNEHVALVTGGAGGIGRAVSQSLALHGAKVVSADLAEKQSLSDSSSIQQVKLNVTSRCDVNDCIQDIVQKHGRLDILVNVAGIVSLGNARDLPEAEWDRVMNINLKGTFLCCQAAMSPMRKQQYGRIINLGSVIGKNGGNPRPWLNPSEQDRASNIAYGVSKAGVHVMTSFLAKELAGSGITVNAVAPGPVASAMTTNFPQSLRDLIPVGRMGQVEDIARAVLFLAAPQSSFITGEVLDVNGGIWCD